MYSQNHLDQYCEIFSAWTHTVQASPRQTHSGPAPLSHNNGNVKFSSMHLKTSNHRPLPSSKPVLTFLGICYSNKPLLRLSPFVSVSVFNLCCYKKYNRHLFMFINNRYLFIAGLEAGKATIKVLEFGESQFLVQIWPYFCCISTWELSEILFCKDTILIPKGLVFINLITSQRIHLPIYSHLGLALNI